MELVGGTSKEMCCFLDGMEDIRYVFKKCGFVHSCSLKSYSSSGN